MKLYERLNKVLRKMESDPSILINDVLLHERDKSDGAMFEHMLKGIRENRALLDALLHILSTLPLKKYRREEYFYLLIGAYAVMYLDRPDYAIVNEVVQLMKRRSPHRASATNAILRRLAREKDALIDKVLQEKPLPERLSMQFSVHLELTEMLLEQFSPEEVEAYYRFAQKKPAFDLCVIHQSREEYKKELSSNGVNSNLLSGTYAGLRICKDSVDVASLPGFQEGSFYIMGHASQMLCEWVPHGERLLDLCAAPGGKSICIKNRIPEIRLTSCDISQDRLITMKQNFRRVKIDADVYQLDGLEDHPAFHEKYDIVLLDAPCTSSGLLQRHADLRQRITRERLEYNSAIQKSLLRTASNYVKNQGFLIYSTCSILNQEGSLQIESFLRANKSFSLYNPFNVAKSNAEKYFRTYPWLDECDGFFGAVMQRMR